MAAPGTESSSFAEELAAWEQSGHEVELRERLKAVPGWCVLDAKEENILNYAQGDWLLVERDFQAAFSPALSAVLEGCCRGEVSDCLAVRRELINYKKLCLHLWQAGVTVEKDLRQLASFFYCDMIAEAPGEERRERYAEIACSLNECKGAVRAIQDARQFSKAICALPRHPESGVAWKFEELPESLEVWKSLAQARQFLANREALDAYWAERWGRWRGLEPEEEGKVEEKPMKAKMEWKSDRQRVDSALSTAGLQALLAAVEATGVALPAEALHFVRQSLVARGATKALSIREALSRYCAAVEKGLEEARAVEKELRDLMEEPCTSTAISAGLHLHCEKYLRGMKGILDVLPQLLVWLQPIAKRRSGDERLFVSGSRGAAAFVPKDFPDFLKPYRAIVAKHRGAMLEEFAKSGWTRAARPAPEEETRLHSCSRCGRSFTKLWLHRGLCFTCEQACRAEGRCPFGKSCGSRGFCPHERRCAVCEQWSCEACRLLRGDGEDAWQSVNQLQPSLVFLDFDRTLCTTKAGASPLLGQHSLDPDLAAVCRGYGSVHIVTRNSRKEDIEQFLKAQDVPVCQVHSIKRLGVKSKAEVIARELEGAQGPGFFVDDDVKELTDPGLDPLLQQGRLHRLLFVRAGGKE